MSTTFPSTGDHIDRLITLLSRLAAHENDGVIYCSEESRILDEHGNDGGGHWICLTPLDKNGVCPNTKNHHSIYMQKIFGR